jgi:hypothetical protein
LETRNTNTNPTPVFLFVKHINHICLTGEGAMSKKIKQIAIYGKGGGAALGATQAGI